MSRSNVRTKSKVEVYVTPRLNSRIRSIAKQSGRPISDVVNYMTWLTVQDVERLFVANPARFIKRSEWCDQRLYTRMTRAHISECKDVAWELGIKSYRGKSSGVGLLIGASANYQIKLHGTEYWVKFFKNGEDLIHKVEICLKTKNSF